MIHVKTGVHNIRPGVKKSLVLCARDKLNFRQDKHIFSPSPDWPLANAESPVPHPLKNGEVFTCFYNALALRSYRN